MPQPDEVWSPSPDAAIRQCEILSGVIQTGVSPDAIGVPGPVQLLTVRHAWVLVLSQDCDLDWDHALRQQDADVPGHNKELPNILLCHAYTIDEIHDRPQVKSDILRRIRQNQDERFHTLDEVPAELDREGIGIPELILDFKRYFTIPTAELYGRMSLNADHAEAARRHAFLISPFRDEVARRASAFHARIALPE
jgi:hypothetical protein